MRISHLELEECLSNPERWASSKLQSTGGPRLGYDGATKLAIYKYHKTRNENEARQHLRRLLTRFRDLERIELCEENLQSYIYWCENEGVIVADCKVRINLPIISDVVLCGEISRVDVDVESGGYRAVLLGSFSDLWRRELRMPLIQRAVGQLFQRRERDINIGVQSLDGSGLLLHKYSGVSIDEAVRRATELARRIKNELSRTF